MSKSKGGKFIQIPPSQWIGVKRVVPSILSLWVPSLRNYFSEIEDLRVQARNGDLNAGEVRNLCVLDGVSACAYSIIFGLLALGVHFLAFGVLGISGGDSFLKVFIAYFVLFPSLPTAAVEACEACEALRATFVGKISGEEVGFKLLGPVGYGVAFVSFACMLFLLFQAIS